VGPSIARRRNGGNELVLAPWKGNVIQRGGVATSAGGDAAPEREKGGDDVGWADTNLTG
jgi:hypothetical protein